MSSFLLFLCTCVITAKLSSKIFNLHCLKIYLNEYLLVTRKKNSSYHNMDNITLILLHSIFYMNLSNIAIIFTTLNFGVASLMFLLSQTCQVCLSFVMPCVSFLVILYVFLQNSKMKRNWDMFIFNPHCSVLISCWHTSSCDSLLCSRSWFFCSQQVNLDMFFLDVPCWNLLYTSCVNSCPVLLGPLLSYNQFLLGSVIPDLYL